MTTWMPCGERILASDMLVLATPLYYYGMAAQLKAVIDRFCSANASITARRLRTASSHCGLECRRLAL